MTRRTIADLIASGDAERMMAAGEFDEDSHPRDESGKFTSGGGGGERKAAPGGGTHVGKPFEYTKGGGPDADKDKDLATYRNPDPEPKGFKIPPPPSRGGGTSEPTISDIFRPGAVDRIMTPRGGADWSRDDVKPEERAHAPWSHEHAKKSDRRLRAEFGDDAEPTATALIASGIAEWLTESRRK